MKTIDELRELADNYNKAVNKLGDLRLDVKVALRPVINEYRDVINKQIDAVAAAEEKLYMAIEESASLFVKPRSKTICGIKIGFQNQKDKLEFKTDEKTTADLIIDKMPEKAEALIKRDPKIIKTALSTLTEDELKEIDVELVPGRDEVLIKVTDDSVSKIVTDIVSESGLKAA